MPGTLTMDGGAVLRPVDQRIFQSDMSDEELALSPSFTPPHLPVEWGTATAAAATKIEALDARPAASGRWRTVQQVIAEIGSAEFADSNHAGPTPAWNRR